jgi:hypothetical protein
MKAQEYALIIIIGLISLIVFRGCQQSKLEKKLSEYQERLDNQWDSTIYYKDKFNKEHAVAERITVEKYVLQNELKWISQELKIKPKQIKGTARVVTNIDTFFKVDSFYQDPYIKIVKIKDTVKLKLIDTLQVVDYWKRKWILSSKKYYVDIKNSNPYVKTTSIMAREIKVKKPTILIGPSVNFNGNLSVGISILYYPLTLKL